MSALPLLSDLLLLLATGGIGIYCWILSGRLRTLDTVEGAQVDDAADGALADRLTALEQRIAAAEAEASEKADTLRDTLAEADDRIGRLELLLAGLEDVEADLVSHLDDPAPEPDPPELVPTFRATRANSDRSLAR